MFLCEFIFVVEFDIECLLGSSDFATFHRVHSVNRQSVEGLQYLMVLGFRSVVSLRQSSNA